MKRLRLYPVLSHLELHWLKFKRDNLDPLAPPDLWLRLIQRIDVLQKRIATR